MLLSPGEARKALKQLTQMALADCTDQLKNHFKSKPHNGYEVAVGTYVHAVRRNRNTGESRDHWFPIPTPGTIDKVDDAEAVKIERDFYFIKEYLVGEKNAFGGALTCARYSYDTQRPAIFLGISSWSCGIAAHIAEFAFGDPILGRQLNKIAGLCDIITGSGNDIDVLNKYRHELKRIDESKILLQQPSEKTTICQFFKKAYDIISCILFPVAIGRAMQSKIMRGSWNFFKPNVVIFMDQAKKAFERDVNFEEFRTRLGVAPA